MLFVCTRKEFHTNFICIQKVIQKVIPKVITNISLSLYF